jgi:hypothetical protein
VSLSLRERGTLMSEEDQVLDAFHRFQRALMRNDTGELDRLMAPGYRGYSLRGELEGRTSVLDAWAPGGVRMDEFSYEDLRIDLRGEVGILTGSGFISGDFMGEPWEHHVHFCDLYVKSEAGWQVFLSHTTEVEGGGPVENQLEPQPPGAQTSG